MLVIVLVIEMHSIKHPPNRFCADINAIGAFKLFDYGTSISLETLLCLPILGFPKVFVCHLGFDVL